jgi:polysaccharide pyruvyl transferase WcaK-like protein
MHRREFLATLGLAALGPQLFAAEGRPQRVLLRSSWQTVNIGDIGHTPGMLHLLEQIPNLETWLWPSKVDNGVEEMLLRRFPKLRIVKGAEEVKVAFAECDFLLHGSGPSLVAAKDVARWRKETGKHYGIGGITLSAADAATVELLNGADFVFLRDSVSQKFAVEKGVTKPPVAMLPDAAFAVDLQNEEKATAFLRANGLEDGKFLCVIPRLRYTPYWKIRGQAMTAEDERKHARNEEMKEHDHAPLREAIIAVLRETEMKVLVCPEDQSQMEVGKQMLVDPLPPEVKAKVVWREQFWLTDEAVSVYRRSAGLFGNEMHSPIMCIGNGIPAIVCRFAEQTSKGLMWHDLKLDEWLFDLDRKEDVARIVPAVLALAKDPAGARKKAEKARKLVGLLHAVLVQMIRRALTDGGPGK